MKSNKKWSMLTLIMMFWFTISFITNIPRAVNPRHLSITLN